MKLVISKSDWIFDRQIPIMENLLGERVSSRLYKSPFRPDKTPTCSFYNAKSGRLYLKDWAMDEVFDVVDFYAEKNGLDRVRERRKAIDKLYNLYINTGVTTEEGDEVRNINKQYAYEYIVAPWDEHYWYWKQYGVSIENLMFYGVYVVKSVYVNFELSARSTKTNPIFAYNFSSRRTKFYRPLAEKKKKWSGNSTAEDVNGYAQLYSTGKLLIITKSMKDVICLRELGFSAIAPNGEGISFEASFIKKLKKRFQYFVVLYDNDEAGVKHGSRMASNFDCKSILLTGAKDISDLIVKVGKRKSNNILKKLLSRTFKV